MDPLMLETIREIKRDIREMDHKIDQLLTFKWKVVGGTIVMSGILTIALHLLSLAFPR